MDTMILMKFSGRKHCVENHSFVMEEEYRIKVTKRKCPFS